MKAIFTKYVPPTNTRGSRIKAFDEDRNSVTISFEQAGSIEDAHRAAAEALIRKMKWNPTRIVSAGMKNGFVWTMLDYRPGHPVQTYKVNPRRRAKRNPTQRIRSRAKRATALAKTVYRNRRHRGASRRVMPRVSTRDDRNRPAADMAYHHLQVKRGSAWVTLLSTPYGNTGLAYAKNLGKIYAARYPGKTFRVFWPDAKDGPRLKKNPAARGEVSRAAKLFENFTGEKADREQKIQLPPPPKTALAIGPVLLIGYSTIRDGKRENYIHRFSSHARPLLAASSDGRSVFMLGGAYTFTDRGIVDAKRR